MADEPTSRTTPAPDQASISNGPNARPRNESIAQSAGGMPNDTSQPIEVDDAEVERIREKLLGDDGVAETEAHPT